MLAVSLQDLNMIQTQVQFSQSAQVIESRGESGRRFRLQPACRPLHSMTIQVIAMFSRPAGGGVANAAVKPSGVTSPTPMPMGRFDDATT